jgi:predicted MFS family arabinose efflux permease
MDILVESFSANSLTGKIRTTYFTFINAGWILSPIGAAYLIGKGEYNLAFLVAAFLVVPFFLILISQGKKLKDRVEYSKEPLGRTMKKMLTSKNLRGIFFIAFLLQLFYSSAVIYIPFHLFHNLSMSWDTLGPIFSLMLIPFVLVEIPAGIIADKYLGEKEFMALGFLILVLSLFLFYYIKTPTVGLWAAVLFASRIGAALIEAMKETYFFKIINVEAVSYINIFRATTPLAYVAGSGLAIITLLYFPLNYLFLFLAIIMLSGFGFILSIKDTK